MEMHRYVSGPFTVTHLDHGVTLQTLIHFGPVLVANYLPGTRHLDVAQEVADAIVEEAARKMTEGPFAAAILAEGVQPVDGLFGDEDAYAPDAPLPVEQWNPGWVLEAGPAS